MSKKTIYWIIFVLALIGLGVSVHLLQIDYNVKFNPDYVPECDLNSKISCSKVADSEYSSIMGVPVASLGILGYLLVLLFMLTAKKSRRFYSSLFFFYLIFSVVSIYFFVIAKVKINAVCLFCLATYIVNWLSLILLGLSVFKFKHDEDKFCLKDNFKTFFDISLGWVPVYIVLIFAVIIPSYRVFGNSHDKSKSVKKYLVSKDYPGGYFNKEKMIAVAGSDSPKVTIVLYSDYECPYCERFEITIKKILNDFKNIKLIRKEFPLDNKCNVLLGNRKFHRHACDGAFFAKCAGLMGKFWRAADLLHANRKRLDEDSLMLYARKLGISVDEMKKCLKSQKVVNSVKNDIKEALKLGLRGTPGYTLNGKLYTGAKPYKALVDLIIKNGGILKEGVKIQEKKNQK